MCLFVGAIILLLLYIDAVPSNEIRNRFDWMEIIIDCLYSCCRTHKCMGENIHVYDYRIKI